MESRMNSSDVRASFNRSGTWGRISTVLVGSDNLRRRPVGRLLDCVLRSHPIGDQSRCRRLASCGLTAGTLSDGSWKMYGLPLRCKGNVSE